MVNRGEDMKAINRFKKDRDDAVTAAVMNDDFEPLRRYCRKYSIPIPTNENVFRAGTYKAAGGITALPEEVKRKAAAKAIALGFSPEL